MQQKTDPNNHKEIENLSINEFNQTFENIINQRKFNYSFKDIIWEVFWFYKWKSWEKSKLRRKIFKTGIKQFHSEMDYIYIIKSIRELKALVKLILNQDQHEILQLNLSQSIDPNDHTTHEIKYSSLSQINIPNEDWSQRSVAEFERQVSKILMKQENNLKVSNTNVSNVSEFPLYQNR